MAETCAWPKCEEPPKLMVMRVYDAEVFEHCIEHHVVVERLMRRAADG